MRKILFVFCIAAIVLFLSGCHDEETVKKEVYVKKIVYNEIAPTTEYTAKFCRGVCGTVGLEDYVANGRLDVYECDCVGSDNRRYFDYRTEEELTKEELEERDAKWKA